MSVVYGTRTDENDVALQFDVENGSVGRYVSKRIVPHDGNNRGAGGEAHALIRPNTRGSRRIETEVTVMVGRARNQVPHWNREITLDVPCGINAGPGIGVGAAVGRAVVNVGGHDGSPVFLHFAVEIGSGRGNVGRGLGLDDRKLGLDQEGHDQSRCVVVVQATQQGTVGIFEDQVDRGSGRHHRCARDNPRGRIDGQAVGQSEGCETGWRTSGYHGVGVCVLGESLVGQTAGKHGRTGRRTEGPEVVGSRFLVIESRFHPIGRSGLGFGANFVEGSVNRGGQGEGRLSDRRSRRIGKESTCFVEHTVYVSFDSSGWSVDYARDVVPLIERSRIGCRQGRQARSAGMIEHRLVSSIHGKTKVAFRQEIHVGNNRPPRSGRVDDPHSVLGGAGRIDQCI